MERDPIDDLSFWKERIEDAEKRGLLHRSVYLVHPEYWKKVERVHKEVCDELIGKTAKVLDAGCGYGRLSPHFDHYVGVDFSPDFLERARSHYPNKTFIQADLKSLPFEDGEFDWAICASIKQMIIGRLGQQEWDIMFKELKRVSKRVLILDYIDPSSYSIE